jgi:hypothetical protein
MDLNIPGDRRREDRVVGSAADRQPGALLQAPQWSTASGRDVEKSDHLLVRATLKVTRRVCSIDSDLRRIAAAPRPVRVLAGGVDSLDASRGFGVFDTAESKRP